jgi:hypothetical protein
MTYSNQSMSRPSAGCSAIAENGSRNNSAPLVMSLLMPEGAAVPATRRLVILVPDVDLDEGALSRRVWTLAAADRLAVLYLGLSRSDVEAPRARRRLASLAALTRDDWVNVNTALAVEVDWLDALGPVLQSGDLIVCHTEQTLRGWGGPLPLGNHLCQHLQKPVHLLEGFYAVDPLTPASPLGRFIFWGGSVVILAAAFWLQVQISALPKNWAEGTLMALSVVAECGLIGLWSRVIN